MCFPIHESSGTGQNGAALGLKVSDWEGCQLKVNPRQEILTQSRGAAENKEKLCGCLRFARLSTLRFCGYPAFGVICIQASPIKNLALLDHGRLREAFRLCSVSKMALNAVPFSTDP